MLVVKTTHTCCIFDTYGEAIKGGFIHYPCSYKPELLMQRWVISIAELMPWCGSRKKERTYRTSNPVWDS